MDLICMGNRKRQDLLSKLRTWGPWGRVEGEGIGREGSKGKLELNKNQLKNTNGKSLQDGQDVVNKG